VCVRVCGVELSYRAAKTTATAPRVSTSGSAAWGEVRNEEAPEAALIGEEEGVALEVPNGEEAVVDTVDVAKMVLVLVLVLVLVAVVLLLLLLLVLVDDMVDSTP
jgi:hypothetical protein